MKYHSKLNFKRYWRMFSLWNMLYKNDILSFWLTEYVRNRIKNFRYNENELNNLCNIVEKYADTYEQGKRG